MVTSPFQRDLSRLELNHLILAPFNESQFVVCRIDSFTESHVIVELLPTAIPSPISSINTISVAATKMNVRIHSHANTDGAMFSYAPLSIWKIILIQLQILAMQPTNQMNSSPTLKETNT